MQSVGYKTLNHEPLRLPSSTIFHSKQSTSINFLIFFNYLLFINKFLLIFAQNKLIEAL